MIFHFCAMYMYSGVQTYYIDGKSSVEHNGDGLKASKCTVFELCSVCNVHVLYTCICTIRPIPTYRFYHITVTYNTDLMHARTFLS